MSVKIFMDTSVHELEGQMNRWIDEMMVTKGFYYTVTDYAMAYKPQGNGTMEYSAIIQWGTL